MKFYIEFDNEKNRSPENYSLLDNTSAIYDYTDPKEETEGAYYIDLDAFEELEDFITEVNYEFAHKYKTAVCFETNRLILV